MTDPVTKVEVLRNQDDPKKFLVSFEVTGDNVPVEAVRMALTRVKQRLRKFGVRVNAVDVRTRS